MAVSANVGGWIADTLVSKGLSVTIVRKVWAVLLAFTVEISRESIFFMTGRFIICY